MQANLENNLVTIKNVVLYDPWQYVSGFVEARTSNGTTTIKVRHNIADSNGSVKKTIRDNHLLTVDDKSKETILDSANDLLMSLTHMGKTYTFELTSKHQAFEIDHELDLEKEILICIMQKEANQITTVASGILNHNVDNQSKIPNIDNQISAQKLLPELDYKLPSPNSEAPDDTANATIKPARQCGSIKETESVFSKTAQIGDIIKETKNGISRETPEPHGSATQSKNPNLDYKAEESKEYKTQAARTLVRLNQENQNPVINSRTLVRLNQENPIFDKPKIREIDQLLRQVCKVDDQNRGICETCPYRDHFFGD